MSADLLGATPGVDFPAAVAAFRAAESAAIDAWRSDLNRADWASPDEYRAADNDSSLDYEDCIATAVYTLESAIAGDPIGQWITANALRSWTDDALTVLENLPCTGQELHEVARGEGWCATWWDLWSQAIRDGAVTDVSSVRRMIDALAERGVTATWESTGGGFCDIISAQYVRDGVAYQLLIGESGGDTEYYHEWSDVYRTGWAIQREEVDYGGRYEILIGHAPLDEIELIVATAVAELESGR